MDQADDLKAFERRMTEIVSSLQPSIWRWRLILLTLVLITLITLYSLIMNTLFSSAASSNSKSNDVNDDNRSSFFRKEVYFFVSLCLLIFSFLFGIHRKIFASSIIIARFRYILTDYNMSCDSHGRLIIKPRASRI